MRSGRLAGVTDARLLVLLLTFLAVVPAAAQADIQYMETEFEINSTETEVFTTIIFEETPGGEVEIPLFYSIDNFEANTNFRGGECQERGRSWGTSIVCNFRDAEGPRRTLRMKYTTRGLVRLLDDQRMFQATVRAPQRTERMVVRARLAQGFVLAEEGEGPLPPFTPVNGTSGSDGRHIYVVWEERGLAEGEGIEATVLFERVLPESPGSTPLILVMGSVGVIVVLLIVILMKRKREEDEILSAPMTVLKDDEREIVEMIDSVGGLMKQRDIVNSTDFSKAKVSRLIRDLESRGLVSVKPTGRTNEVKLREDVSISEDEEE